MVSEVKQIFYHLSHLCGANYSLKYYTQHNLEIEWLVCVRVCECNLLSGAALTAAKKTMALYKHDRNCWVH